MRRLLYSPFFIKLTHWEYWPFNLVYTPIYIYWFWLCIKARSFFFFSTSNPTIINAGFLMESKKQIYDLLPKKSYPPTLFFQANTLSSYILQAIQDEALKFPLVGKPDIGMQGLSVKKLENREELVAYAANSRVDFLVQEFIPYELEVGIFYYRYPGEEKGHISGIVEKQFLTVIGDGISTIEDILKLEKRYVLQLSTLKANNGDELKIVLAKGEKHVLVPYGNHVRGAKFLDVSNLIDDQLTNTIDALCQQVRGFYFGRMDIRYKSWDDLRIGKNFSVIELNGAGSEPTHMYDPRHSIFFAWKEIIRHLDILYKISRENHRLTRKPYMSVSAGLQMLRANKAYVKLISVRK